MSGLTIRCVECKLHFNQPAPIRPLATATLRGLAGDLLKSNHPEFVLRWFKPGDHNHLPPAYLFEAIIHEFTSGESLPFKIRTWDPHGELLPAFRDSFTHSRDRPFGESGAKVAKVVLGEIEPWSFEQRYRSNPRTRLEFLTPVRLKASGRFLDDEEITLGHVVEAAVRRLDDLSDHYGNRTKLDKPPLLAAASKVRETSRSLRSIRAWRLSSTQGTYIDLSGVTGQIRFVDLPGVLVDVLSAATVFHIGHSTAEGCGEFRLSG